MIDFTFTEEQELFRQAAREFAETKVAPKVKEMEETGEPSEDVIKALGEGAGSPPPLRPLPVLLVWARAAVCRS